MGQAGSGQVQVSRIRVIDRRHQTSVGRRSFEIDARADAIAEQVAGNIDADVVRQAAALLRDIRKELEARLRASDGRS